MELRIFCEPQQGASYDDILQLALVSEEGGFGAFFRSDHYLKMGSVSGLPGPSDAWITLAGLARDTTRIRLGTLLTSATFRLPGPLAIAVAEVDAMSEGRVELGLGAGWFGDEHTAYGIPFPALGSRFERLEEQLAIITGLWGTPVGDTFDFAGTHYSLAEQSGPPQALPVPPTATHRGRPRRHPHAPTRRDLRRRVQRALRVLRRGGPPVWTKRPRLPGDRSRPLHPGTLGGGRGVLWSERRRGRPSGGQHRARGRRDGDRRPRRDAGSPHREDREVPRDRRLTGLPPSARLSRPRSRTTPRVRRLAGGAKHLINGEK